jgi:hypothetical protein
MSRHSANQTQFQPLGRGRRPSSRRFDAGDNTVRVVLVAIHRGPQPAAFLGPHPLQRLQVLLSAPGEEIEFDPLNTMARMTAGAPPQLLPQMPVTNGGLALRPRLVQGEILSDDDGRLYEKVGRRIRPLQRLFSGPRGEVLELPAEAQTEQRPQSPQAPDAEAPKPEAQAKTTQEEAPRPWQSPQRLSSRPPQRSIPTQGPEPRRQPPRNVGEFASPHSAGRGIHREPLQPEDCAPNFQRRPSLSTNPAARGAAPSRDGGSKTAIPEQWVKPWEFQISREEALYDMQAAASSRGGLLALIRDMANWFGRRKAWREAWRKWQSLLAGKSLDEQLWAVRPPRGMISRSDVRDWALRTLGRAGYDPRVTLVEWEIYWRRKGL